ncbi:MAG: dipeptidase [Clostridia bacterium]|nr:dipeptidase [Clostridia bacterium]
MFVIDGHCDTLSKALDEGKSIYKNDLQFSLSNSDKRGGGIQVMSSFIDTKYLNSKNGGFNRCNKILNYLSNEDFKDRLICNKVDFSNGLKDYQTKILLSIENGAAISGKLENVKYFYNRGVRMMSITWNDDNELGCGALTRNDFGLTNMGKKYVKLLNEFGIIVDVSHLSEKSFWNVINLKCKNVIASHSNVYEICRTPRNLKDSQIKAIAENSGVIGVCFYSDFLNERGKANVMDVVNHIKYIKELVGIDYVGLGSDFDGMSLKKTANQVENIIKVNNIIEILRIQGFSENEIEKIMWKNWYNFLKRAIL